MASYNKVMLMGNLTRDPEVRYTPKGSAVADLSLAVNRVFSGDNGEKREEVTYVDVVLWARLAELAGQFLKRGNPVFIEGRLQMDQWEDKQTGQKRSRLRVVGEVMQFLGGKREGESASDPNYSSGGNYGGGGGAPRNTPAPRQQGARPAQQQQRPAPMDDYNGPITDDLDDDDIPF